MTKPRLKSVEFRERRQEMWLELQHMVGRIESSGFTSLSPDELRRLPVVYRATLSSLAIARAVSLDKNVVTFLESLCARAYLTVYGPRRGVLDLAGTFVMRGFPREVRRLKLHLGLAWCLILLGALVAHALYLVDPEYFFAFVPAEYAQGRGPDASTEALREVLFSTGDDTELLAPFASFLISHNSQIGLGCVALGAFGGIPVIYLLGYNGLVVGAFNGLYIERGLALEYFSWILPHGITEFLAVALCGAAGLYLGEAVVFPGVHHRLTNLRLRARTVGIVTLGAVILFFIAGLVEGFFRQLVHQVEVRYAVAGFSALFWVLYFTFMGTEDEDRE